MYNKKQPGILIAIIAAIIGLYVLFFLTFFKTEKKVQEVKAELTQTAAEPKCTEIVKTIITKENPWESLQPQIKDTVVQVFSQIANFNWVEPYKTPNQGQATGTGFFINERGDIATNAHVVDEAKAVTIQIPSFGKRIFDVEIVGVSPDRDMAILRLHDNEVEDIKKVLGKIPYLELGNSDEIKRASEVMTLGYPLGQQSLKSTTGVVSGRES